MRGPHSAILYACVKFMLQCVTEVFFYTAMCNCSIWECEKSQHKMYSATSCKRMVKEDLL